jgi:hypothetical protein
MHRRRRTDRILTGMSYYGVRFALGGSRNRIAPGVEGDPLPKHFGRFFNPHITTSVAFRKNLDMPAEWTNRKDRPC